MVWQHPTPNKIKSLAKKRKQGGDNPPITIFVTAYKSERFIEDCLDSIEAQDYFVGNDNYEVLLGIDNCWETLIAVNKIRDKYRNLRVFFMLENYGTYVTSNTLMSLAKHDLLLRFDSDDVMYPFMIRSLVKSIRGDVMYFQQQLANEDLTFTPDTHRQPYTHGQVLFTRAAMDAFGGFLDWRLGADTELRDRVRRHLRVDILRLCGFLRRTHPNSLVASPESGMHSLAREEKMRWLLDNPVRDLYVEPVRGLYMQA